jgi:GT2 family glycosyltransferase
MIRGQDTEYYRRFRRHGLKVCYEPSAVVHHPVGADRLAPRYMRQWYSRTGHFGAYLIPWKRHHLATVMPIWWYLLFLSTLQRWLWLNLARDSWWNRFRTELALRELFGTFRHRLRIWSRWLGLAVRRLELPALPPGGALDENPRKWPGQPTQPGQCSPD